MRHTVTELTLKNKAKGLLIHVPDATVMTFDFNFRAGEYLVEETKWEVPHLMEHVLLGANKTIPRARDFQAELEKNGAYSNATTGVYDITYEAECADFEWERVLRLMLSAITEPLFLKEEYEAEFGNVQEEMAARSNNHFRRLSLEMRQALGMIAKTDMERLELMENVTIEDVQSHYVRTHHTPNMRFIIAGDLMGERHNKIIESLETIDLPDEAKRFKLPREMPKRLSRTVYVENDTVENIYFYFDTFSRTRLSDPDNDALNLLSTILTDTLYSKILGTARERGLVYGMNSGLSNTRDVSNWWFGAQVSEKNAPALMSIIVDELKKVLAGDLDEADIEAAKMYSLGRFQRSAQTVGGTAGGYGRYFFDEVVEDFYEIPQRIRAVTKERIVEVARRMFADDIWGFGVLGNCGTVFAESLRAQLAVLWEGAVGSAAVNMDVKPARTKGVKKRHARTRRTS